jgi:gluconokinase
MRGMSPKAPKTTVVTLDIGTSSCRAGVFDGRANPVRGQQARRDYALITNPSGSAVLETPRLVEAVEAVLDELHQRAGERLRGVAGVGVSCFMHSLVGLDASGRPDTPILSWADTTGGAAAAAMRERLAADEIRDRTGCELAAAYWPARIQSLRDHGLEIAGWAGFPDLLMERLVGWRAVGVSMASATGLFDRRKRTWDGPLLKDAGLTANALPELVPDGEKLGILVPDLRWRWPALAEVPWLAPWADGACSNVGAGCLSRDRVALMIGTSGALRAIIPDVISAPGAAAVPPAVPPGLFGFVLGDHETLLGGHLSEGGGVVAWLTELLGRPPAKLEEAAAAIEPDGHGLSVLPFLAGERGPGYRADARGWIGGLTLATEPAALYRALLEAIALRFVGLDKRLAVALGRPGIVATGAAIQASPLWQQILADALGERIEVSSAAEASSRGAALLTLRSLGALDDVAAAPPQPGRVVEPSMEAHACYQAAYERQEALYRRLLD